MDETSTRRWTRERKRERAAFHIESNVDSLSNGGEITAISVLFDVIPVEVVAFGGCDITATITTNATTSTAVAEVVSLFCC